MQVLLEAIASDFFDPPNMLRLHEALFPEENFSHRHSPGRVAKVLNRLRVSDGTARTLLKSAEAVALIVRRGRGAGTRYQLPMATS